MSDTPTDGGAPGLPATGGASAEVGPEGGTPGTDYSAMTMGFLNHMRQGDIALALGVSTILVILILPLPLSILIITLLWSLLTLITSATVLM